VLTADGDGFMKKLGGSYKAVSYHLTYHLSDKKVMHPAMEMFAQKQ
jgi:hypothetical protein